MNQSPHSSLAVLVVEDEPVLRINSVDFIEEAGFKVYEANDADEAIALLEQHDDVRFLFTDVEMPGSMDGIKLSHFVRGRWPPVAIIITSGHPKPHIEQMPAGCHFLGKPYHAHQVTCKLLEISSKL